MDSLILSPNCPLALRQGTFEAEPPISDLVSRTVNYHLADGPVLERAKRQMEEYRSLEFTSRQSPEVLTAARGCARTIESGECPFWRFDESSNSLVQRMEQFNE